MSNLRYHEITPCRKKKNKVSSSDPRQLTLCLEYSAILSGKSCDFYSSIRTDVFTDLLSWIGSDTCFHIFSDNYSDSWFFLTFKSIWHWSRILTDIDNDIHSKIFRNTKSGIYIALYLTFYPSFCLTHVLNFWIWHLTFSQILSGIIVGFYCVQFSGPSSTEELANSH